ncbi:MarR family transcriptional regulator [Oceanispirochaeta sp.]|jgi:DNA-binding MarR family transcriptional regulator|uniref:MarR family winged helix-turn-helix transcriptional regulator n=1 Tax=Oceanispirochaeta sp. TaxID=2035350 RepID=UPI00261FBAA2|nr:MarR family transcriptional regulator [Oceanispirochaeta sp.]MDA3957823.1 MarR family transcriptional regulator [Oceanispirochaeta sp.]
MKLNNINNYTEESNEVLSRLAVTIERLSYSLENHERNAISTSSLSSLTGSQIHCLDMARHLGKVRIGQLAEALAISMPTATVTVNLLEKKGYLNKEKSRDDRRAVVVNLTAKGLEISNLHDAIHKGYARQMLGAIGSQNTETLNTLLIQALNKIDADSKMGALG